MLALAFAGAGGSSPKAAVAKRQDTNRTSRLAGFAGCIVSARVTWGSDSPIVVSI
jgi:hypothetical protein